MNESSIIRFAREVWPDTQQVLSLCILHPPHTSQSLSFQKEDVIKHGFGKEMDSFFTHNCINGIEQHHGLVDHRLNQVFTRRVLGRVSFFPGQNDCKTFRW